jgi:ribosomal protein S18 acetylase RimI-like enzyme
MKLSNKDIILQDNRALYYFRFLPWDTEFFGLPSYSLDVEESNMVTTPAAASLMETQFSGTFVTAKVDTSKDYGIVLILLQSGFQYIDTEVTFECRDTLDLSTERDNILITKLKDNKSLPYEKFGSVYSLTRFHTDPHITSEKADQLWVNYLKNYVCNDRHQIFAAIIEKEVAGVVLVDVDHSSVRLSFVGVRQRYQSQGIGSLLVQEVIRSFKGMSITVGTQIKNTMALNFYIQNGFSKIQNTKTILHRW